MILLFLYSWQTTNLFAFRHPTREIWKTCMYRF